MRRKPKQRETVILSIKNAAERFHKKPDQVRYLCRKAGLEPVEPPRNMDKRCTYYTLADLLSIQL